MKKIFHIESITEGKTLLYCSVGENTGDVEVIELPRQSFKNKECDCEYEIVISDKGLCKNCEDRFYKSLNNPQ